jgi:putative endonuclease
VDRLVWFEAHQDWESAIRREKQIKEWKRAWKIQLIEADNPQWIDLYYDLKI